jgi:cytochrome c peroxidase
LQNLIAENNLSAYKDVPEPDTAKVALGRMLFFDKLLSGNKDISCATCHHPGLNSGDNLSLAIGVGGEGLGEMRKMGKGRKRIPRNSPEIFNRGSAEWHSMFWDSRVTGSTQEGFDTPVDQKLPEGLESILAVQAMFPVFARDEMRGKAGDVDIFGEQNELALISNAMPQSVWFRLMQRILQVPQYRDLFKAAYPEVAMEDFGFQHAANAIAAFEINAFTFTNSPWDRYLNGDLEALSPSAIKGALLFYGKANCVACHTGNLLTDQKHHNIGVPQFGPGKDDAAPLDAGRFMETGKDEDLFAFRTPPLRNVSITGPWMHNGAYVTLEDVIRHHADPEFALRNYDLEKLTPELRETYKGDATVIERLVKQLDPEVKDAKKFQQAELDDLLAFMEALTDPAAKDLSGLIPDAVPSGLPVEDLETGIKKNYY